MANPFSVSCPNCDARLKIQNPQAVGKKVRCPNCQNPFTVQAPRTAPPEDDFGLDDEYEDDYDYDDAPPRRSAKRPPASRSPRGGGRRSQGGKKSRKKSSNNNTKIALLAGGAVAAFLLLVGFGFLIYNLAGGTAVNFAWLPPNSQIVVSIDVDEIWNSSVIQRGLNNPDTNS